MAGNVFLPRLFILQLVGLIAAGYCVSQGWYGLAIGCVLCLLAFTIPVYSAYSEDPKMAVNGDILTRLQAYTNEQIRIIQGVRIGRNDWGVYYQAKAEEEAFRSSIEIDPNDPRCIYRWKK